MTIAITPSTSLKGNPKIRFPENDNSRVEVIHPAGLDFNIASERLDFLKWLEESLVQISCRMLMIEDAPAWLEQVAGREYGFSRALSFGDGLTLNRSVLGKVPKTLLTDWIEQDDQSYVVMRDSPWRTKYPDDTSAFLEPPDYESGSQSGDMIDKAQLKHTDHRVLTPIDIPLWNRAKWKGNLFVCNPGVPPLFAIGFEDSEAGQAIFRVWKDRYGSEDIDKIIRVALITGLSERNPTEYSVVIGPNFSQVMEDRNKIVMFLSRINRMTPETSENLDMFISAYKKKGIFFLAPVFVDTSRNIVGMPSTQLAIAKRQLDIREAWQIGENDPDRAALLEDDDPIIPTGVSDPPVNKALASIRTMRKPKQ